MNTNSLKLYFQLATILLFLLLGFRMGESQETYDDEFDSATLDSKWSWIREAPTHWSLTASPGNLRIITQPKDIWRDNTSAPLLLQSLESQTSEDFDVRTRIVMTPTHNYHQGGLVIYADDDNYVRLTYAYIDGLKFEFAKELDGDFQPIQVEAPPDVNDFHLRIVKVADYYLAYYSIDGSIWTGIGVHQYTNLVPTMVGLSAFNAEDVTTVELPADFDYFTLRESGESEPNAAILTTPLSGETRGPGTIQLAASALSDLEQIAFFALYDAQWQSVGLDSEPPYEVTWEIPDGLRSQIVRFRIDATLLEGEVQSSAGGERWVSFQESLGNPAVSENWITTRYYLNQRSLDDDFDDGDNKCSATSVAMVLAMLGLVPSDYASMAATANDIYPELLIRGSAYVYKMRDALIEEGAVAAYNDGESGEISAELGWQIVKREVDAGRPVIVRTARGVVTGSGHIVVGVGYREEGTSREMITYDPYGQWKQTTPGDYYLNSDAPESQVGKWVYYDFDRMFGNYLITARNADEAHAQAVSVPDSPPDEISREPRVTGVYDGVDIVGDEKWLYLPYIQGR